MRYEKSNIYNFKKIKGKDRFDISEMDILNNF